MRGYKKCTVVFAVILFTFLVGCGSSNVSTSEYNSDVKEESLTGSGIYSGMDQEMIAENGLTPEAPTENVREGRKLIRTANLTVETLEFDNLLSYVEERTNEYGGYIESLDVYNGSNYLFYDDYYNDYYSRRGYSSDRSASMTIRIPKNQMDSFLSEVAEHSNITNRSEQEQDVTLTYVDLESHKSVLLAEQKRLLELMDRAETIEDLITIESRLSEIRYQIESMESTLRTYDNQIEYSTIYLSISEVVVLTPITNQEKTVGERISEGFMNSLKNIGIGFKEFFVGFVIFLPYLILFAVIILLILWIVLFSIKKCQKKEAIKRAEKMQTMQMMNQSSGMMFQSSGGQYAPGQQVNGQQINNQQPSGQKNNGQ